MKLQLINLSLKSIVAFIHCGIHSRSLAGIFKLEILVNSMIQDNTGYVANNSIIKVVFSNLTKLLQSHRRKYTTVSQTE